MKYFKIGQRVYSYHFGSEDFSGIVEFIDKLDEEYPITVSFIDVNKQQISRSFTIDGKHHKNDCNPALSQIPLPKIELVPLEEEYESGEMVWCQICKDVWDVRYYSHIDAGWHYVHAEQKKTGSLINVLEIRKFTDNPLI